MNSTALNIKNREVERLAAEVATIAGESKTDAIGRALVEKTDGADAPGIGTPTLVGTGIVLEARFGG